MKNWAFGLGTLAAFAFAGCGKQNGTPAALSSVIVTNIINTNRSVFSPTGSVSTVMVLTNGIYFGYEADHRSISVDFPGRYAAWIYYDANNQPRKMVHQFYGTNRYWLTDIDADGVPDMRVDYNEGPNRGSKSILIKGEWVDADVRGTNATVVVDQKSKKFHFLNGKWTEQ